MARRLSRSFIGKRLAEVDERIESGEVLQNIFSQRGEKESLKYLKSINDAFKDKVGRYPRGVNDIVSFLKLSKKGKKRLISSLKKIKDSKKE